MNRAALLLAFTATAAAAQPTVSDKALHGAGSALLGSALRAKTDSQLSAFLGTVAIGTAKELTDPTFSSHDMTANVIGAALATLTPPPDQIGVMAYSFHYQPSGGTKRHLTNRTPGVIYSWRTDLLPFERSYIDAALYSNSQGYPGAYAGLSAEWQVLPRLFVGAGAGLTWGYREYRQELERRGAPGLVFGCIPDWCVMERTQRPRVGFAVLGKARLYLGHGISLQATYMPAGSIAKATGREASHYFKSADALSVGISYRKAF